MERVYSGEAPQDPAPFQADEIIGFDFVAGGWVSREVVRGWGDMLVSP